MSKLVAFIVVILGVSAMVLILPMLGAIFGAFCGWVVGFIFDEPILKILDKLGVNDVKMWEIGCFLGFVGGFFKTRVSNDNK